MLKIGSTNRQIAHLLGLIGRHREGSPASNLSTIGVSNWTQLTAQCLVGQIATPQFQTWREGHDLIDVLGDFCSVNDKLSLWGPPCAQEFSSFLRLLFSLISALGANSHSAGAADLGHHDIGSERPGKMQRDRLHLRERAHLSALPDCRQCRRRGRHRFPAHRPWFNTRTNDPDGCRLPLRRAWSLARRLPRERALEFWKARSGRLHHSAFLIADHPPRPN